MTQPKATDVDSYIEMAAETARPILKQLRQIITSAAPEAEESISYGMPYYRYHGRLAYFAAHKNHVGLYALGPASRYPDELKPFVTGKGTLQFRLGESVPEKPIRDLVEARVSQNHENADRPR